MLVNLGFGRVEDNCVERYVYAERRYKLAGIDITLNESLMD